jgi:hypothetical protein
METSDSQDGLKTMQIPSAMKINCDDLAKSAGQ